MATSSNTHRITTCIALVVMVLISTAATMMAPVNFSGEWTLNEGKSKFGDTQFGRMAASTLKVTQGDATIAITRIGTSPQGQDYNWEEKLTADGKETESTVYETAKRKSTMKWSKDKKSFTINAATKFERDGNTMEIITVEIWKLSDDGKTLTVDATSTSSFGTNVRSLVYDKSK